MSWQRDLYDPALDSRPLPLPRAAVRRGAGLVALGLCAVGLLAFAVPAFAETISIGRTFINGSEAGATTVSLTPSTAPGELAIVTLENRHVNDGRDTATYPLAMEGLAVLIAFTWDADPVLGSDRITVTPPLGVTCVPEDCSVTVMEGFTGEVILIDWRGM